MRDVETSFRFLPEAFAWAIQMPDEMGCRNAIRGDRRGGYVSPVDLIDETARGNDRAIPTINAAVDLQ
jgi:hypothetical protein